MNASPTQTLLRQFQTLLLIRSCEEQLVELNRQGAPDTCSSIGQEACAVGVIDALEARDRILTNHRSAAHLIARGADPKRLFAEVLGRVDGYCGGHSGTLHIAARELGVVLTSTIVGGELSLAPGVALAQKMGQGDPGAITAVFFGDGAACEGIFHEALNLAAQWQLPLLFVCENNQWQAYVHRLETMADNAITAWAEGHGIVTESIDGNDLEAVHAAATRAVAAIRADSRPRFLELRTYRLRGHSGQDDQAYVDAEELHHWQSRDPLRRLQQRLTEAGQLDPNTLEAMTREIRSRVEEAVAFAHASPWPDVAALIHPVYA